MARSILFLIPCARLVYSAVFRVYDYLPYLERAGYRYKLVNYRSPLLHDWLYLKGGVDTFWNRKNHSIYIEQLYSLFKMAYVLVIAKRYDIVFIQKATPPAWFVAFLKFIHPRIIFDLDDAVFLTQPRPTRYLIKNANAVISGSHFLETYCKSLNPGTHLLPTPVETSDFPNFSRERKERSSPVNIGWVGTLNNLHYLQLLEEPLKNLANRFPDRIQLTLIGHTHQKEELQSRFSYVNLDLQPAKDPQHIFELLRDIDIGVMPLQDGDWERGKCASKALLYMAASVPVVCSAVGENCYVIEDGINGFLAVTPEEWESKLSLLIENISTRQQLGEKGRITVEKNYSTKVCFKKLHEVVLSNVQAMK